MKLQLNGILKTGLLNNTVLNLKIPQYSYRVDKLERQLFFNFKKQIMKTIIFLSVATIGMSTDNYLVMSGALLICGILIFKNK